MIGPLAPFSVVEYEPPVDALDDEFPIRLTTGRRLDSYNTGVQTGRYASPTAARGDDSTFLRKTLRSTVCEREKWCA